VRMYHSMLSMAYRIKLTLHPVLIVVFFLATHPAVGNELQKETNESVATHPVDTATVPFEAGLIEAAKKKVSEDPSDPSSHITLGYLLIKRGALDEASLSFDEALRINPRSSDAKTGKGIILARQGRLNEAEAVLKDALVLNPSPVRTHYELGLVYEKLGDLERALAEFKEAIRKHEQGR
jgi:Tfp pilus assembly protein PilF